ncbi:centromere protein F-like isoform X1 [Lacerta agilis]|uniref:centromere protein F-like isoform X1 n=1 Tax=Lacerta agilis TaxID=80427 RepID=UPI0014191D28|nr:centromere protein F-like isoform X1 [Lacerta agilis]
MSRAPTGAPLESTMSWPGEEWKVGLPSRALRAIAEVEQRLERLQKERQQKQVQLDTLEAMMHKQRQKHDEERASWALLSQENRSLAEACEQLERSRQRLAQELQAKEAQLSCLEAQLAQATRRQTELEEELRAKSNWTSCSRSPTWPSCPPAGVPPLRGPKVRNRKMRKGHRVLLGQASEQEAPLPMSGD